MHESGGIFLSFGTVRCNPYSITAWSTASSSDQQPLIDVDMDLLSGPDSDFYPLLEASRDLSTVGMCRRSTPEHRLEVLLWR